MKRLRKGKAPEVDTALNQWFGTVTSKGQKLSGPILKEKAEDLAIKLGHTNFVATEGWLSRWSANKKAWMTSQIFTEWLAGWDSYLTKVNRKILLLVDNCTAHPHVSTLKNIQLEFLPPITTSLIQPMDQGIIKNLKTLYCKELVHTTRACIEENILNPSSTAIDVSFKISIPQAVSFVAKSWRAVKEATIINCFRKADFFTLSPCVIDGNDEEFSLPDINNGEKYNNIP